MHDDDEISFSTSDFSSMMRDWHRIEWLLGVLAIKIVEDYGGNLDLARRHYDNFARTNGANFELDVVGNMKSATISVRFVQDDE